MGKIHTFRCRSNIFMAIELRRVGHVQQDLFFKFLDGMGAAEEATATLPNETEPFNFEDVEVVICEDLRNGAYLSYRYI